MRYWVVKAKQKLQGGVEGWHWNNYLGTGRRRPDTKWGGPEWIKSDYSRKLIRDDLQAGDLVVCYQGDNREILGLTRLASAGKQDGRGRKRAYCCFDLDAPIHAFKLNPPLSLQSLRDSGCYPKAFTTAGQGTVYPLQEDEFLGIVACVMSRSKNDNRRMRAWLKHSGYSNRPGTRCRDMVDDESVSALEGATHRSMIVHRRRERKLRDHKIRASLEAHGGRLICEVPGCRFDFRERYGSAGEGFAFVHHLKPLDHGPRSTRLQDLAIVCANCHAMIHRGGDSRPLRGLIPKKPR